MLTTPSPPINASQNPVEGGGPAARHPVECSRVSKKYGPLWALNSISLRVDEGESIAVLGTNGAGKTTLLRIIATQLSPTSGRVRIFGRDSGHAKGEVRGRIGFSGHTSFMYDELTVEENLRFYGKMFSLNGDALSSAICGVLETLNIQGLRHIPVKKLSHGLRKRADLARTFLHSPSLVILDEPFSGLDEASVAVLLDRLRQREGRTFVFSSHSADLATRVSTRTIALDRGLLIHDSKLRV